MTPTEQHRRELAESSDIIAAWLDQCRQRARRERQESGAA